MRYQRLLLVLLLTVVILAPLCALAQGSEPRSVVDRFYGWYFKNLRNSRELFTQQKPSFDPELYGEVSVVFKSPEAVIDFDPFTDAQEYAAGYSVGAARIKGSRAIVPVSISFPPNGKKLLNVELKQSGGTWRIYDIQYHEFNLLAYLKGVNHKK